MPSLIIYFDSNLNNKIQKMDLTKIDDIFIKIIIKTLKAEEEKCQILWIDSKINASKYKVYCELKFRESDERDKFKKEDCLNQIGNVIQKKFNVNVKLRAFANNETSITALDLISIE
jgi:hypothetical protein